MFRVVEERLIAPNDPKHCAAPSTTAAELALSRQIRTSRSMRCWIKFDPPEWSWQSTIYHTIYCLMFFWQILICKHKRLFTSSCYYYNIWTAKYPTWETCSFETVQNSFLMVLKRTVQRWAIHYSVLEN